MGKLEPEFILPVGQPVLDGIVTQTNFYVLTPDSIVTYERNSRRRLLSFEIGDASPPLGVVLLGDNFVVTYRDGLLKMYTAGGDHLRSLQVKTSPGFCKPVVFEAKIVYASSSSTASEGLIIISSNFEQERTVKIPDRKDFGIPLSLQATENEIICAFESGDILIFNQNFSTELTSIVGVKCQLMSAVMSSNRSIFIGQADGQVVKYSDDGTKSAKTLTSPAVHSAVRKDGKLLSIGYSTGEVALYSTKTLKLLSVVQTHGACINRILWDKLQFFVFSSDCLVSSYQPYDH